MNIIQFLLHLGAMSGGTCEQNKAQELKFINGMTSLRLLKFAFTFQGWQNPLSEPGTR